MKTPKQYSEEIMDLGGHFYQVLDGLIKKYPQYKVLPNDESISTDYTIDKEALIKLQEDLFLLKNSIQKDIEDLEKQVVSMDTKITVAEKNNLRLQNELTRISDLGDSAEKLLQDTQYLHNEDLASNIILFLIIILLSVGFYNLKKEM